MGHNKAWITSLLEHFWSLPHIHPTVNLFSSTLGMSSNEAIFATFEIFGMVGQLLKFAYFCLKKATRKLIKIGVLMVSKRGIYTKVIRSWYPGRDRWRNSCASAHCIGGIVLHILTTHIGDLDTIFRHPRIHTHCPPTASLPVLSFSFPHRSLWRDPCFEG